MSDPEQLFYPPEPEQQQQYPQNIGGWTKKQRLICQRCQHYMGYKFQGRTKVSWWCDICGRTISKRTLLDTYKKTLNAIKNHYNLEKLTHSDGYWVIKSGIVENDGEKARRLKLTKDIRFDVRQDIIDIMQSKLGVVCSDRRIESFWLT